MFSFRRAYYRVTNRKASVIQEVRQVAPEYDIRMLVLDFNLAVKEFNKWRLLYCQRRYGEFLDAGKDPHLRTEIEKVELDSPGFLSEGGVWILHWAEGFKPQSGITGKTLKSMTEALIDETEYEKKKAEEWKR